MLHLPQDFCITISKIDYVLLTKSACWYERPPPVNCILKWNPVTKNVFKVVNYEYPFAFSVMSVMPQFQERILGWSAYPLPRLDQNVLSLLDEYYVVIRWPPFSALPHVTPNPMSTAGSTFWKTHKQETGTKESMNWNTFGSQPLILLF